MPKNIRKKTFWKLFFTSSIYWIIIPIPILGILLCFYFDIHRANDQVIFNSLKIITTGIAIITFTITFVNIARNKSISTIAKEASQEAKNIAQEAKADVLNSLKTIKGSQSDFRLEILRNCLENNEYRRSNDQLKEIKSSLLEFISDETPLKDPIHVIITRIEDTSSILSIAIKNGSKLKEYDFKKTVDLLAKIDTIFKKKIKQSL